MIYVSCIAGLPMVKRIILSLTEKQLKELDDLVDGGIFQNRTEAIRAAVRELTRVENELLDKALIRFKPIEKKAISSKIYDGGSDA